MDKVVVGIDLGTTFSSVAYVNDEGRPVVIPNPEGKNSTPSVVLIQAGRIAVGEVALNQWVTNEEHVVRWIKRAMGDSNFRFQELSAVEISAEILKTLKAEAELYLATPLGEAVITCPAYFASIEIENTKRAGELAGFHVREIVKEPTAAAVHYGVEHMQDGEKLLVCDLGGGTYDATILAFEAGVFTPLASMGDRQLGGHDWTMELVELVARRFQEKFGDDPQNDLVAGQMLYEACEQAKRDFARLPQVTLPCQYQGRMEQITVTREEFEARTEWRIQALVMWSERALEKAGLTWQDINQILLVGGSSRLRRMALALEEKSGKKVAQSREPDLTVALGAAILARGQVRPRRPAGGLREASPGGLVEVVYKRTAAHSLGTRVIAFDRNKPRITTSLIIQHGTEMPVTCARDDYEVASQGQKFFDVPVVEFENDDEFDVIGNYRFHCLANPKRGDRIKVTFDYDINGIATVEAVDLKSGKSLDGERQPYQEPNLELSVQVKPRWVVFAVDTSGSMAGIKLENAKEAVIKNAKDLLAQKDDCCKIGIVSFDSGVKIVSRLTSDLAALKRAVDTLKASGTTAMDEGISQAVELALQAPAGTDRDVVMLTDGMPDSSRRRRTVMAAEDAKRRGVTLSALGVGKEGVDLEFLKSLATLALKIEVSDNMTEAMGTLLAQSAAARGGLTDR